MGIPTPRDFTEATYNVNGIKRLLKKKRFFKILDRLKADIVFISETKASLTSIEKTCPNFKSKLLKRGYTNLFANWTTNGLKSEGYAGTLLISK